VINFCTVSQDWQNAKIGADRRARQSEVTWPRSATVGSELKDPPQR